MEEDSGVLGFGMAVVGALWLLGVCIRAQTGWMDGWMYVRTYVCVGGYAEIINGQCTDDRGMGSVEAKACSAAKDAAISARDLIVRALEVNFLFHILVMRWLRKAKPIGLKGIIIGPGFRSWSLDFTRYKYMRPW